MRLANLVWDRKTSRRVIRGTLKLLAKPYQGFHESTLSYVIKICTFLNGDNKAICNAVPKARHIFVYRNINLTSYSAQRVLYVLPTMLPVILSRWFNNPNGLLFILHMVGTRSKGCEDISYRYSTFLEYLYRIELVSFLAYRDMRERGLQVTAVRYEDLVQEPDRILTELLKIANMPESLVPLAKNALKTDSQATQPFNQREAGKLKKVLGERDPEEELLRDEMQELYEEAGVPGPRDWEREGLITLPGTI